jgi:hypothetical protein
VKQPLSSLFALLFLSLAVPGHADSGAPDSGSYHVSREGKVVGTETFSFKSSGDSLIINSNVLQLYPAANGQDTCRRRCSWWSTRVTTT